MVDRDGRDDNINNEGGWESEMHADVTYRGAV